MKVTYRTRTVVTKSKVIERVLPKGFRFLKPGEIKRKGDLFPEPDRWVETMEAGTTVRVPNCYIRRIKKK